MPRQEELQKGGGLRKGQKQSKTYGQEPRDRKRKKITLRFTALLRMRETGSDRQAGKRRVHTNRQMDTEARGEEGLREVTEEGPGRVPPNTPPLGLQGRVWKPVILVPPGATPCLPVYLVPGAPAQPAAAAATARPLEPQLQSL
jgi:hypothetical protein